MRAAILEQTFHATNGIYRRWKGRPSWGLTTADLLSFPDNTLGNDVGRFLSKNGLEPLAQSERHDVFHVLTRHSTNIPEEVELQFHLLGNGKRSLYMMSVVLIGLLFYPDRLSKLRKAYLRGKAAFPFYSLNFQNLLSESTDELRAQFHIQQINKNHESTTENGH